MIGLTLRLSLVLAAAISLTAIVFGAAYLLNEDRDAPRFRAALPVQVGAIVETFEALPPAQRGLLQQALASDGLSISLSPPDTSAESESVRGMPALSWMVSRYTVALGNRKVEADLVNAADGRRLRLRTALSDGTPLSIEMRSDVLRRLRTRQASAVLAGVLLLTAVVSIWGLRRQIRPIEELARAMDRYGTDDERPLPPPRGAPELRSLHQAFQRASRRIEQLMDDRSRLFADISHDLGTYLTRLRLRIELIDDEVQRGRAEKDIDHMAAMLRDLLQAARLQSTPAAVFSELDFRELLSVELDAFGGRQEGGHIRRGRWPVAPVSIQGDAGLLRRMIANLLDNAVKHGGGRIDVELVEQGAELCLRIDDRGPGIPESERERVLQPFYRGDAARNLDRHGSGLGLAIVTDVVRRHRGRIQLRNRPEGGLAVSVWLPLAPASTRPI